ncbi:MAG: helix-turn-helix transcriptional regulator [Vicinamibacteraceae bacterium]
MPDRLTTTTRTPDNLIRSRAVRQRLGGISNSTFRRWIDEGRFPRSIKLPSGHDAWRESQVEAVIATWELRSVQAADERAASNEAG